jgi:hypothetical protein
LGLVNASSIAIFVTALALSGCQNGTSPAGGGAPNDGPVEADDQGPPDAPVAAQDSSVESGPGMQPSPEGGGISPGDGAAAPPQDAGTAQPEAGDAAVGACAPLSHGPAVVPVIQSGTGVTYPVAAGGPIQGGTYYLTSLTEYYNPNFSFNYCAAPGSFTDKDTIVVGATSPFTGSWDEDLEYIWPDGGTSTQLTSATYTSESDAGTALLGFQETCPSGSSQYALLYTATSTQMTTFQAAGPVYGGQPTWPPACYVISTYTKQ